MWKKRVLLCSVEAMNLVDKKNCLSSELESFFCGRDDFANAGNSFGYCREWNELAIGVTRDQSSNCRLA